MNKILLLFLLGISLVAATALMVEDQENDRKRLNGFTAAASTTAWMGPDTAFIPDNDQGKQVRYGRELIVNTAKYLGPKGSVAHLSNGMNCQNCHLNAGAAPWGNNYFAVASTYPRFRARSGQLETKVKRINDCFERSLAGQALDSTGREMQALIAYMDWLGTHVPKDSTPVGSGIAELPFPDRAADPVKGQLVYEKKCASCHGTDGLGKADKTGIAYQFPPLWGPHSYNEAAGLFRMSRFAGFVKDNMPLGATHAKPQLTDEEAWDVAAFVNSQPRPTHPFLAADWPDVSKKPLDHPFGPYADPFSEAEHKYGPFGPIRQHRKAAKAAKAAQQAQGQPTK